ncbi:MAG TPA: YoaK family protein [Acidimicrobiales bacterium]|nr:YoaK family protein [Acidimicrobiales bacterium]
MSEPQGPSHPLVLSLATLTVVSGVVDAVSYLGLGHVFTANMTGNVVLIGFALAGAPGFSIAASATALAAFLAGAATGGRIGLRIKQKRSLLVTAVSLEAGFTVVAAIIAASVAVLSTGWPRYTVIAVLGYAMGIRNSVVRNMGVADMTTTVLTMTLTGFAADSSLGGGHNPNATRRIISVACMLVGALVGAAFVIHVHPGAALGLAAVLTVGLATYLQLTSPLRLGLAP